MLFFARVWTTVTTVTQYLGFSSLDDYGIPQQPIGGQTHSLVTEPSIAVTAPPLFEPPGSNIDGFKCDYSNMGPGWVDCTDEPGCWLKNLGTGENFTVNTDYETLTPIGIMRNYTLTVTDQDVINRDGINFTEGKLFNGMFPGPLLEACWGDTLNITVINNSKFNGTSIHWHGIRQLETMQMDGVNGVTQCPIAPGDSFTYIWNVTQYGSSWYHSHYSVQYADGLQAPITLHGPVTTPYDEAVYPLITSDWLHNSAFEAIYDFNLGYPTILLNGTGNCTRFFSHTDAVDALCDPAAIPNGFELIFDDTASGVCKNSKKRYLLRVINTSFSTSITFSIDNHQLIVVEADFVPVEPKTVDTLLVAIGQRYHVIVEANPVGSPATGNVLPKENNFWIRTHGSGCSDDVVGTRHGFERTGILRYDAKSTDEPKSRPWPGATPLRYTDRACVDTLSTHLKPAYNWTVGPPSNGVNFGGEILDVTSNFTNSTYALGNFALNPPKTPYIPFQTTYGNPTILNLDNFDDSDPDGIAWPAGWVVIPENFTDSSWVYLIIQGGGHPIHLHGHDFAILNYTINGTFDPSSLKGEYHNPMRRDVVLLPNVLAPGEAECELAHRKDCPSYSGYVVIAFKTDNPGSWLMHCHIALHASWGLAVQIMERQTAANALWPPGKSDTLMRARKTCAKWNSWAYDCRNAWPGEVDGAYPACSSATELQSDSGI